MPGVSVCGTGLSDLHSLPQHGVQTEESSAVAGVNWLQTGACFLRVNLCTNPHTSGNILWCGADARYS
jgi:hypothetical protein